MINPSPESHKDDVSVADFAAIDVRRRPCWRLAFLRLRETLSVTMSDHAKNSQRAGAI